MKKVILVFLLALTIFTCVSCVQVDNDYLSDNAISALGEEPEKYKETVLSTLYKPSQSAEVKNLYYKDNKYIIYSVANFGYNGPVEVAVLISYNIILNIKGLNIKETEGYGSRAFEDSFLNQFINVNVFDIDLFVGGSKPSENTNIIYVTHATRTSTAITSAINETLNYYKTYIFTID